MTREELIEAFERVYELLDELEVSRILAEIHRARARKRDQNERDRSPVSPDALSAYASLRSAYESYGEIEQLIISELRLEEIFADSFWSNLFTSHQVEDERRSTSILNRRVLEKLDFFQKHVPSLLALLDRNNDHHVTVIEDSHEETIIFPDSGKAFSLSEISARLTTLDDTYRTLANIYEVNAVAVIGFVETGSDLHINIFGNAQPMKALRDIIMGIFDKNLFRTNYQKDADLQNMLNNLDALTEVERRRLQGEIGEEDANRYRHFLAKQIDSLGDYKVATKEILSDREEDFVKIESKQLKKISGPPLHVENEKEVPTAKDKVRKNSKRRRKAPERKN